MKILNNSHKNLQFTKFQLTRDSNTGKTWEGETSDKEVVLVETYMGAVLLGIGEDLISARQNFEEILEFEFGEDETIDEKELFRILKWRKI